MASLELFPTNRRIFPVASPASRGSPHQKGPLLLNLGIRLYRPPLARLSRRFTCRGKARLNPATAQKKRKKTGSRLHGTLFRQRCLGKHPRLTNGIGRIAARRRDVLTAPTSRVEPLSVSAPGAMRMDLKSKSCGRLIDLAMKLVYISGGGEA